MPLYDSGIMDDETYNELTENKKVGLWYGSTKWHLKPQMFIRGFDYDKQDYRDFAVTDIIEIEEK